MEGGAISVGLFYGAFLLGIGRAYKSDPREANAMIAASAAWLVGTLSLSWEVDTVTWLTPSPSSLPPVRRDPAGCGHDAFTAVFGTPGITVCREMQQREH